MSVELAVIPGPRLGRGGSTSPSGGAGGTIVGKINPIQIVGFVPLEDCSATECRSIPDPCGEWCNVVFGTSGATASAYENDISSFLISFALYQNNPSASVTWYLQECVNDIWSDVATLNNNNYGTFYALNSITNHKTYTGYKLSWGKVLQLQGEGVFRIRAVSGFGAVPAYCLQSKPFKLLTWDCDRAHGTVKFESMLDGKIGDIDNDGKIFDICTMQWRDSIRFPGFFGMETTPEYLRVMHEYQTGLQKRIKDEAIQKFELTTRLLPKWMLDRFKVYGCMADELMVSDYNLNNSDYNIRQKMVVLDSGFEPQYRDRRWIRMANVTAQFKEGIQGVIKSSCCDARGGVIG